MNSEATRDDFASGGELIAIFLAIFSVSPQTFIALKFIVSNIFTRHISILNSILVSVLIRINRTIWATRWLTISVTSPWLYKWSMICTSCHLGKLLSRTTNSNSRRRTKQPTFTYWPRFSIDPCQWRAFSLFLVVVVVVVLIFLLSIWWAICVFDLAPEIGEMWQLTSFRFHNFQMRCVLCVTLILNIVPYS